MDIIKEVSWLLLSPMFLNSLTTLFCCFAIVGVKNFLFDLMGMKL